MISKRLQILITLMFVTMMFVQTPAMAGSNAVLTNNGLNTKPTDYQSGNQFSSGKTTSVSNNQAKSNLNKIAKVSSLADSVVAYNQSGTTIEFNSSYVHPGQYLNVAVNSSDINNFVYNNTFDYQIQTQYNQLPYNSSSSTFLVNGSTANNNNQSSQVNYEGQTLNQQLLFNSTSYSQIYGVNVSTPVATNETPTMVQISWTSTGNTTSIVKYGTSNTSLNLATTVANFRNIHSLNLTNLNPSTVYYYRVFGLDYFGRTINGSLNTFKTMAVVTGYPTINNVTISAIGINGATLTYDTNINTNATIAIAQSRTSLNTGTGVTYITPEATSNSPPSTSHNIPISGLKEGTQYYFKITAINGTDITKTSTDTNGGLYYTFITQTNAVQMSGFSYQFNTTSLNATVTFQTVDEMNTSLVYSLDPNFVTNVFQTNFDGPNTTHEFTIKYVPAMNYYFKIQARNATNSYTYTFIKTVSSVTYYSFTGPRQDNQYVSNSYFNFAFQIPTYPAVLGIWQFKLTINQQDWISSTTTQNIFSATFIVNDTLTFNVKKIIVQRGTYTNDTGTYPIWMDTQNVGTYSPTDNIALIGNITYSTSSQPLNRSIWGATYATTGKVNLFFDNKSILTGSSSIFDVGSSPLLVNSSFYSGLDPNIYKIVNVSIPAVDIYGDMQIQLAYNMPHTSQTWQLNGYTQLSNTTTLPVKYRLSVTKSTGESSYSLTTTNMVGSVTIIPLQYENITQEYGKGNFSNFIPLPGKNIDINLSVTLNGVEQNIFEFTNQNYTWYWHRPTLDSSLKTGTYNVSLTWIGKDGSSRGILAINNTAYDSSPAPFIYSFTLEVSFAIKDLTAGISVLPGKQVTLRFKVIVPATGIAWDQNLGITNDNGVTCAFDPITGEYQINVTAPTSTGIQNVTLKSSTKILNLQLSYKVSQTTAVSTQPNQGTVITNSITDLHVSLIGFAWIGAAIIGTVLYGGIIVYYLRKR